MFTQFTISTVYCESLDHDILLSLRLRAVQTVRKGQLRGKSWGNRGCIDSFEQWKNGELCRKKYWHVRSVKFCSAFLPCQPFSVKEFCSDSSAKQNKTSRSFLNMSNKFKSCTCHYVHCKAHIISQHGLIYVDQNWVRKANLRGMWTKDLKNQFGPRPAHICFAPYQLTCNGGLDRANKQKAINICNTVLW